MSILRFNGSWGCDPEFFLQNTKTRRYLPAWKVFKSEKELKSSVGGAAIPPYTALSFWDGFQAEMYSPEPTCCIAYKVDAVRAMFIKANELAKPHGAQIVIKDVIDIPKSSLRGATAKQLEFGCNPSRNAYNICGLAILDGKDHLQRYAGGHIHMGIAAWCRTLGFDYTRCVKILDRYVGLMHTAIFEGYEDPRRRRYYGLPGEYRLPVHGLEYRTLSPYWMLHPALAHMTFELCRVAVGVAAAEIDTFKAADAEVIDAIGMADVEMARTILHRNWQAIADVVLGGVFDTRRLTALRKLVLNGWQNCSLAKTSFQAAWKLSAPRTTTQFGHSETFARWADSI